MAEATIAINIKGNTADINAALERLSSQLKRTATQSDQTGKRIRGLSTSMKAIKRNLTGLTAGFFSAYGAVRLFGTTTDILAQFEHEMMRVKVTSVATEDQFAKLTKEAADLGKTTVFTQTEVAQGMRFLAMSGMEVQEILDSQQSVLNLAQIGMIGLGRASDIATNIMQAFGINAQYMTDVVDDLTTTISSSNTNMTQLGDAIKYVGPVASGAGIPLRDVAAAVGTLSNAGLQGSMAGTGLRMVLMR
jgi:TP901 family phage tail tape measure protein